MQGAESVLLEQGVMGAMIVLLLAAVVALWISNQKQGRETRKDLRNRNNALTTIIEKTIDEEQKLAAQNIEQSREFHTTLTLLTNFIKEMREHERGQDYGHSS